MSLLRHCRVATEEDEVKAQKSQKEISICVSLLVQKKFILFEEIMANGLQIHEFFDGSNKLVVLPRQLCRYTEKLVAKALEI